MTAPLFKFCACGHLGRRHCDDGSCAVHGCACERFGQPRVVYARATSAAIPGKGTRRNRYVRETGE